MTVETLVAKWLRNNGYDGLYYPGECACLVDDLAPCCENFMDCSPGYRYPPEDDEADFTMCAERPPSSEPPWNSVELYNRVSGLKEFVYKLSVKTEAGGEGLTDDDFYKLEGFIALLREATK